MTVVDVSADIGEGFPWDFELLRWISSASIACGGHTDDLGAIREAVAEATRLGVTIGAHPSWPDVPGFGRVERSATADEVRAIVERQVGFLSGIGAVGYVKPHGALYNQAMRDEEASRSIREGLIAALATSRLPMLGLPDTDCERLATNAGIVYVHEGFPDRGYREDGRLIPRNESGAIVAGADVPDAAIRLVRRGVRSLCLHGDAPGVVDHVDLILHSLGRAGIDVRSFA